MAILKKDDLFAKLSERTAGDTSDETLTFIEDVTDTFNDLETRADNTDADKYKKLYEESEKTWRERYRARFFTGEDYATGGKGSDEDEEQKRREEISIDDLFKTKE